MQPLRGCSAKQELHPGGFMKALLMPLKGITRGNPARRIHLFCAQEFVASTGLYKVGDYVKKINSKRRKNILKDFYIRI